jgi:hypothetical protein
VRNPHNFDEGLDNSAQMFYTRFILYEAFFMQACLLPAEEDAAQPIYPH